MTATFNDLRDASVFITGGGSRIGASLAEGVLERVARVASVGRPGTLAIFAGAAVHTGNCTLFVPDDIADTAADPDRQCPRDHPKSFDAGKATLLLASDASPMMTGQAMVVTG